MAPPKKKTQKFQIQLESAIIQYLRTFEDRENGTSANSIAADWIREKYEAITNPKPTEPPQKERKNLGEIDFRELFFQERESHNETRRMLADAQKSVHNLTALAHVWQDEALSLKKLAESAAAVKETSASTVSRRSAKYEKPDSDIGLVAEDSPLPRSRSGSLLE